MSDRPPRYEGNAMRNDRDEQPYLSSPVWEYIQSICVVAALAITIAVLALAVQSRGLGREAISTARTANDNANKALNFTSHIGDIAGQVNQLGTKVLNLQNNLTNLTENFNALQSVVQDLEGAVGIRPSAVPSTTGSSGSSYGAGARHMPSTALSFVALAGIFIRLL
ncbi:hypothetical protein HII31_10758 [Pseudocercospora fuligena]|uniref:Uncharacterized protein n=1 Tax=Pseudocercospora fuligena TaxID=685502 RepID=A0A8H6VD38_9PEZI|nr:hypothetical protein HII31_10758 [Pseudocercospora fuligena]